jgi:hypothetical protein
MFQKIFQNFPKQNFQNFPKIGSLHWFQENRQFFAKNRRKSSKIEIIILTPVSDLQTEEPVSAVDNGRVRKAKVHPDWRRQVPISQTSVSAEKFSGQ